jgi:hypothetical protein
MKMGGNWETGNTLENKLAEPFSLKGKINTPLRFVIGVQPLFRQLWPEDYLWMFTVFCVNKFKFTLSKSEAL